MDGDNVAARWPRLSISVVSARRLQATFAALSNSNPEGLRSILENNSATARNTFRKSFPNLQNQRCVQAHFELEHVCSGICATTSLLFARHSLHSAINFQNVFDPFWKTIPRRLEIHFGNLFRISKINAVYRRILNWNMFAQGFAQRLRCSSRDIRCTQQLTSKTSSIHFENNSATV